MYVHDLLQAVADTRARRAVGMGFDRTSRFLQPSQACTNPILDPSDLGNEALFRRLRSSNCIGFHELLTSKQMHAAAVAIYC